MLGRGEHQRAHQARDESVLQGEPLMTHNNIHNLPQILAVLLRNAYMTRSALGQLFLLSMAGCLPSSTCSSCPDG